MENNRNWQGWAALALAGLALLVALIGRNPSPPVTVTVGQAPQAPRAQVVPPGPPDAPPAPEWRGRGHDFHHGFGPGPQGFDQWQDHRGGMPGPFHRGGFPFFLPFMLLGGLIKLAGIVLVIWLLTRLFRSRRDRPQPPTSPTVEQL